MTLPYDFIVSMWGRGYYSYVHLVASCDKCIIVDEFDSATKAISCAGVVVDIADVF